MEELKKYHEATYYDCDDIAAKLIELSNLSANVDDTKALHEAVSDAMYQIKATAQNPYNHDFYRVFYNVLLAITGLDFD